MKKRCDEICIVMRRVCNKQHFWERQCSLGLLLFILCFSSLQLYAQVDHKKTSYVGNQERGHIELIDTWGNDTLANGVKEGFLFFIAMSAKNLKGQEVKVAITIHSVFDKYNPQKLLWESKMVIESDDIIFPKIKAFVPQRDILKLGAPLITFYTEVYDMDGNLLAKRCNVTDEDMRDSPDVDLRIVYTDNKIVKQNDIEGIKIHANMYIHRMKGSDIYFCTSFFQKDGMTPLRNSKGEIITWDGKHTVTCDLEHASDMWIFIPYYIIDSSDVEKKHYNDGEKYDFLVRFILRDKDGHALSKEKEFRISADVK